MHVPFAISAFEMHYVLVCGLLFVRREVLLPVLLLFGLALTLALVIWLGSQARSKAGIRIAWAGVLTLPSFICWMGLAIYESTKSRWR
jgi:hypothetical protein